MTALQLVGLDQELLDNVIGSPTIVESLTVASHVYVDVEPDPALLEQVLAAGRTGILVDDRRFELVGIRTATERTRLVWEDHQVATLRRYNDPLAVPAGSTTVAELVGRFAAEAGVPHQVEPDPARIPTAVTRSDSWATIRDLPGDRRSYTTAAGVWVVGTDAWLIAQKSPIAAAAGAREVVDVDVHLDFGKTESTARLIVEHDWPGAPGDPVVLTDVDTVPWLITARSWRAHEDDTDPRRTVTTVRGRWEPQGTIQWPR